MIHEIKYRRPVNDRHGPEEAFDPFVAPGHLNGAQPLRDGVPGIVGHFEVAPGSGFPRG